MTIHATGETRDKLRDLQLKAQPIAGRRLSMSDTLRAAVQLAESNMSAFVAILGDVAE